MRDKTHQDINDAWLQDITDEILSTKGISVRLLDPEGHTLVAAWDDAGTMIAAQMDSELSEQRWRLRDAGLKAYRTGKPFIHRFGIFSFCSAAITRNERHQATLCLGPFFRQGKSVLKSHLRDFRREYGLTEQETESLIDDMPIEREDAIIPFADTTARLFGRLMKQVKKTNFQQQSIEKQKNEIEWLSLKQKAQPSQPDEPDNDPSYEPFSQALRREYVGYVEQDNRKRANRMINNMLSETIAHAGDDLAMIKQAAIDWVSFLLKVAAEHESSLERLSEPVEKIASLLEDGPKDQMTASLFETIHHINDLLFDSKGRQTGNYHLTTAIIYIRNHFKKKVTLDEVADACSISTYYLSRLFKEEMGVSFIDYLHNIRMEEARRLLRKEEQTVYDTAIECGFSDPNYFSKTFKKYMGVTPSKYKKVYQTEGAQ